MRREALIQLGLHGSLNGLWDWRAAREEELWYDGNVLRLQEQSFNFTIYACLAWHSHCPESEQSKGTEAACGAL